MSNQFVFNQYYIDFIKRLKQASRNIKDEGKENENYELAKEVMKSIKNNYVTLDKSSDEYIIYINKLPDTFWPSYVDATCENINE